MIVATLGGPAAADDGGASSETEAASLVYSRVTYSLSQPATVENAIAAAEKQGVQVTGLRFENEQVIGEISLVTDKPLEEKLAAFRGLYGTEPQVTSLFLDEWVSEEERDARESRDVSVLDVAGAAFIAPPVSEEAAERLSAPPTAAAALAAGSAGGESEMRLLADDWMPQNVYPSTFRVGSSQIIAHYIEWGLSGSPDDIPAHYGFETDMSLYNNATGVRGSILPWELCGPNFRDQFIAKNYDFNSWSVYSYGGMTGTMPYADHNDLFDSCGRNAMSIGIAIPQNIGYYSSPIGIELTINIDAQPGVTSSSRLGGDLQLVERYNSCGNIPTPSTILTDCMDLLPGDPGVDRIRPTLGAWRNWTASYNKCWASGNYGQDTPVTFSCF